MSSNLFTDLSWLPQPPPDFSSRCRSVLDCPADLGGRLQALASFALDENQLNQLAKQIAKARKSHADLKPLVPFRLGLLSNSTVDFIIPAAVGTAARHGIALECIKTDYDHVIQEALSPNSVINRAKPDAVLLAIDFRALPLRCKLGSREEAANAVRQALSFLDTARNGLKANNKVVCILQTIAPPPERLFGSLDRVLPGALRNIIERVNLGLVESVFGTEDVILDVAGLAETV